MILTVFLADLRQRGVRLWAEGSRLRCSAPEGVLTPELRGQLQQRRTEILAFLKSAEAVAHQQPAIVPLQPLGRSVPIFAVAGHNGDVFAYRALARQLGTNQPFYGLQPTGLDGASEAMTTVDALATYFADQIQAFQPSGPYILAGFCAGGTVAFELARTLRRRGAVVPLLVMFAAPWPHAFRHVVARERIERVRVHLAALATLRSPLAWWNYVNDLRRRRQADRDSRPVEHIDPDPALAGRRHVEDATLQAVRNHRPGRFDGRLLMFLPDRKWLSSGFTPFRWRAVASSTDEYYGTVGDLSLLLRGPDTPGIAQHLAAACAQVSNLATHRPTFRKSVQERAGRTLRCLPRKPSHDSPRGCAANP